MNYVIFYYLLGVQTPKKARKSRAIKLIDKTFFKKKLDLLFFVI